MTNPPPKPSPPKHPPPTPPVLGGVQPEALHLVPMLAEHLPQVLAIEEAVYPFPWTQRQFLDCLEAGYCMRALFALDAQKHPQALSGMLGYTVAMLVVDEWHVLNLAVHPTVQGKGLGRFLLNTLVMDALQATCQSVLLEVRASNTVAQRLYQSHGFTFKGMRKQYYPAAQGREDALVMVLPLPCAPFKTN